MIDYNSLAAWKDSVAQRLRAALYGIRQRNIPRLEQSVLEQLAECVHVPLAYRADRDTLLPHGRPLRVRVRHASKKAVVFREAHRAVILYWELIRTDEVVGLDRLIERLEYYAVHGYRNCELLGGDSDGYTLLIPYVEEK